MINDSKWTSISPQNSGSYSYPLEWSTNQNISEKDLEAFMLFVFLESYQLLTMRNIHKKRITKYNSHIPFLM